MNQRKWRNYFIVFLVISAIFIIGSIIYTSYSMKHSKAAQNMLPHSSMNPAYKKILGDFEKNKLTFLWAVDTKLGQSTDVFKYDSLYKLVIFNFSLSDTAQEDLQKIIKMQSEQNNIYFSYNYDYNSPLSDDRHCFSFSYIVDDYPMVNQLHLLIEGDSTQLINQNDSIINYFTYLKKMAISINGTTTNYVYCDNDYVQRYSESKLLPVSILFLKKGGSVFLFIMGGVVQESNDFPKGYLYNLISRK